MLEETDVLLTIAELGIAFAGFAALITIVAKRGTTSQAPLQVARLHLVVLSGLILVVGGIVPIAISRYGVADEWIWRASSGALLLLEYVLIVGFSSWYRRLVRRTPPAKAANIAHYSLVAIHQLLLFLVLVGLLSAFGSGLYISALAVALLVGAFMFLMLIHSLLGGNEKE